MTLLHHDTIGINPERAYLLGLRATPCPRSVRRDPCLVACYREGLAARDTMPAYRQRRPDDVAYWTLRAAR